jgi:ABC-type oligopeptide transport system substrate-binding subunit
MWYSTSPYNRARWHNAEFDRVMDEALSIPDDAARFALYHKAERIIMDDWGVVPTPMTASVGLRKPNVRNVALTPFGFSLFDKIEIE